METCVVVVSSLRVISGETGEIKLYPHPESR